MSVKWHNLKVILRYSEGMERPIVTPQWPMVFDLASDPGELYNIFATKMDMGWMLGVALKFVADFQKSVAQYPNIKTARSSPDTRERAGEGCAVRPMGQRRAVNAPNASDGGNQSCQH